MNHVEHLVVPADLFELVEVVEESVLRLVHLEDIRVGTEQDVEELSRRNDRIGDEPLCCRARMDVVTRQADHIELLEGRDLRQAVVEAATRRLQSQRLLEAEALRDLQLVRRDARQMAEELEELLQWQQVRLDEEYFALHAAHEWLDFGCFLRHERLTWVQVFILMRPVAPSFQRIFQVGSISQFAKA